MTDDGMKRIGYLCSEFPALSHTFISREISILEKDGFRIATASVNPVSNLEKMGAEDRAFAERTYVLKSVPKARILGILARYALNVPRFVSALFYAATVAVFSGPRSLGKAIAYFVEAVLLHAWARRSGVDHVHVHFANPAATVALLATKFGKLEFSMSVHGPDEFYDVEKNSIRRKVEAAVFVRCIGFYCRSQLMRLTPTVQWKKFRIVRCGLYKNEFVRRPPADRPVRNILCVGRLCPSKGQAILVEAAGLLRKRGLEFRVLLLGGGEELEAIKEMVSSRNLSDTVTVAGPVGHARVKEELAACDLFVLPSFAEGIPVALMEAMASGVPVVSTSITGIPELIEHGVGGMLVQPSNTEQLADCIEAFLKGGIDTERLTANAAEKVRTMYDVEENTRKLGSIFVSSRRQS